MKKLMTIVDICIFTIASIVLLIAFLGNGHHVHFMVGAILVALMGVAQAKMASIAHLSEDNPKVKTMRRMNRLTVFVVLFVYLIPLVRSDFPVSLILVSTIMLFTGNVSTKLPMNRYMGLRLPWTTTDERTWRIAHKLLGYLTFPLVLAMVVVYLITNQSETVLFVGMMMWVGIPSVYSFIKRPKNYSV